MIVQIFELRCNGCKERFEDLHDSAIVSHAEVRAEAKKRGWARKRETFGAQDLIDLCPECKGKY
jgi:hypothetical protein